MEGLRIRPFTAPASGAARVPGSKSHTNRALVCAALAAGSSEVRGVLFADDTDNARAQRFARHAAHLGAIFHPSLNWFLCAAHDDEAIDEAVAIAEQALARTAP